jgi:hypothetical protein
MLKIILMFYVKIAHGLVNKLKEENEKNTTNTNFTSNSIKCRL